MKYDAEIDPANLNTSHGLVVDLVGTGMRVLDVGCSTGQLGRVLTERGNAVTGFEVDVEAAAIAEQHLERVVVGDLETDDLAQRLAGERFDVIVFADVLEHLRDPVSVLHRSAALLADGGSVVVSIPNIAHGAVRLALLEGRFDYGDLGLLDRTHLRFFTRSTVDDLFRDAGFTPTDVCRTTADVFATEIVLDPMAFSEEVLAGISDAAESATYQFVVKARPTAEIPADERLDDLLDRWPGPTPEQELATLRAEVAEIVRSLEPPVPVASVGLVSWREGGESRLDTLRRMTAAAELRRRLTHLALRCYVTVEAAAVENTDGEPLIPLLPWTAGRATQLSAEVRSFVILRLGTSTSAHHGPGLDQFVEDLRDRSCFVTVFGQDAPKGQTTDNGSGASVAGGQTVTAVDPLILADRLHSHDALRTRLDYLRFVGIVDEQRPLVMVTLSPSNRPNAAAICRALDDLTSSNNAQVVFDVEGAQGDIDAEDMAVELTSLLPGSSRLGLEAPEIDLLAVVNGADLVISDRAGMLSLAAALSTPYVGLGLGPSPEMSAFAKASQDPDVMVTRADQLAGATGPAAARAADAAQRNRMADRCERAFDDVADQFSGRLGTAVTKTIANRFYELGGRIHEVEVANAGLQRKLAQERAAFGIRAAALLSPEEEPVIVRPSPPVDNSTELTASLREVGALRAELDAVYQLKTMRILNPARTVYGRWRRRLL